MGWAAGLADGLRGNPVLRRELRALRRSRWMLTLLRVFWAVSLAAGVIDLLIDWPGGPVALGLFGACVLVPLVLAVAGGASAHTRERELGTWDSLVLMRLAPHTIVLAKYAAVAYGAVAPALPVAIVALVLTAREARRGADVTMAEVLSWWALPLAWVLLNAAISVRISLASRRTGEAAARAAVAMLLSLWVLGWGGDILLADWLDDSDYAQDLRSLALRFGLLLAWVASLIGWLLVSGAASLPGGTRTYTLPARLLAGASYMLIVCLAIAYAADWWGSGFYEETLSSWAQRSWVARTGARAVGIHALVASVASALLCATARLPAAMPRRRRRLGPWSEGPAGALVFCLCLSIVGSALLGAVYAWCWPQYTPIPGTAPVRVSSVLAMLAQAMVVILLSGAWGCFLATRWAGLPAWARAILAGFPPLAFVAAWYALFGDWRGLGLGNPGGVALLGLFAPWYLLPDLRESAPALLLPLRDVLLLLMAAGVLLWLAFRRRAPGQAAGSENLHTGWNDRITG